MTTGLGSNRACSYSNKSGGNLVQIEPIYTPQNCKFAYQLCWSLTLFWKSPQFSAEWLPDLVSATKADGIRILRHRFAEGDNSLFLVSTRPDVPPSKIPWSLKGRLQHLMGARIRHAFQRNYDLKTVGSTRGEKVAAYVSSQLRQHPTLSDRVRGQFEGLQIINPDVDLLKPRYTAHARCTCNLHLVFVHADRRYEIREDIWVKVREMLRKASAGKSHLLSRVGIVPDHLHLSIGIQPDDTPQDVALSYMNNIAYVSGMKPVLMHGCYIAGFGEYDLGAIRPGTVVPAEHYDDLLKPHPPCGDG